MGYPFSLEEEDKGVVQKIIELCNFENLSSLVVNKSGIVRLEIGIIEVRVFSSQFLDKFYKKKIEEICKII